MNGGNRYELQASYHIRTRELKRNAECTAEEAQARYRANKSNCGAQSKCTPELKETVQSGEIATLFLLSSAKSETHCTRTLLALKQTHLKYSLIQQSRPFV